MDFINRKRSIHMRVDPEFYNLVKEVGENTDMNFPEVTRKFARDLKRGFIPRLY